MMFRASLLAALLTALPTPVATTGIAGEMGYRISDVPGGSPAERHGLRTGDVLAEPKPLPQRLLESGPGGVEIPLYRLNTSRAIYEAAKLRIVFLAGEERRLGTVGDLGFLVAAVDPDSLASRAELKPGDFITQINETFVHDAADLNLLNGAYEKGEQVMIYFARWFPETAGFKRLASRRRFTK